VKSIKCKVFFVVVFYLVYLLIQNMDLAGYQKKMDQAIAYLQSEFGGLQLGRATPGLVDNITVEASYGHMKLNQL
jgi:ribosome recycling factor